MEGQLAAPFHFAVEFLMLAVFAGAMFEGLRASREPGAPRAALARAGGFALLIAAQVMHGTLVVAGDGALELIVLRALGFGLVAASMRPEPAVGLPALFVAGTDARWAAVPAVFALIAASRAFALRRTFRPGAGSALAVSFVCFAGGELALALAPPEGGAALAVSHVARAAGAIFMARWLWLSLVRSVRLRFVAVFVAALVLLASVVAGSLTQVIGHNLQQEEFRRLALGAAGQKTALSERVSQAIQFANTFGRSNTVAAGFTQGAQQLRQLAEASMRLELPTDLDFIAFFNNRGQVVASAIDRPNTYPPLDRVQSIAVAGSESLARVLGKSSVAGEITSSGATSVAAIGAAAVTDPNDRSRLLGAMVVGYNIDREMLLQLKVGAEADITVLKGGEVLSTTYDDPRDARAILADGRRDDVRRQVEEEGKNLTGTARIGGETGFVIFSPLTTENTAQVAGVIALSKPAGLLAASQRAINRTLFLITLAAAALAAALAWLLSGRVTRPIRALTRAARQVRGGDLDARATVELPDEVGTLGEAFNDMAASLKRMTDDLRGAAQEEADLRARIEAIMQSMSDGLLATGRDGKVVAVNRAAETLLGSEADAIIGKRLDQVVTGSDAEGRPLAELALGGNGGNARTTLTGSDGRAVPVALTGAPLRDAAGETLGRVVVLRDVSREQEAERMKSEFLSNVSHELRTPLTPIKGYTEILRRKKFPRAKVDQFLDGIAESTKRLERIVEILVDFAAMEAGRLKPRIEPVDVRAFLTSVLDPWKRRTDRHRFTRKIPPDLPPVLGDERLLRKCLDEVIDNAVKFSPEGGTIEVSAEAVPAAGRRRGVIAGVRLMVRDQGIGIEPSQMGRLFQDFRQLDGSETRSFGGLGLGLSFARRVALAHHGDITATSTPGRGSTFTVLLPAAHPLKAARGADTRPPAKPAPIRRTRRVSTGTRTAAGRKKVAAASSAKRKMGAASSAGKRKKGKR